MLGSFSIAVAAPFGVSPTDNLSKTSVWRKGQHRDRSVCSTDSMASFAVILSKLRLKTREMTRICPQSGAWGVKSIQFYSLSFGGVNSTLRGMTL